jgi:hypothetical protein
MHRLASPLLAAVIAVGGLFAPPSLVARASALVGPDVLLRAPAAGHGTTVNAPRFGWSVSAWRSMLAVGAPNFAPSGWTSEAKKGVAFSFGWDGTTWESVTSGDYAGPPATQTGRTVSIHNQGLLFAGKERPTGLFGTSVATGNVASWYSSGVVGGLTCGGVWEEFGAASSMYERRVAVGNPYGTGCVALREDYSAGTSRVVLGTDVASGDATLAFGQSLASNADWLFVGAPGAGSSSGLVYAIPIPIQEVWVDADADTIQDADELEVVFETISPPATVANANFGAAIAASHDYLVVGSPGGDSSGAGVAADGAVCVFSRNAVTESWEVADCTQGGDANAPGSSYGSAVAISENGERILVGAPSRNHTETGTTIYSAGGAYLYSFADEALGAEQLLALSSPEFDDQAGYSVAVTSDIAVVGAPGDKGGDSGTTANWGSVAIWGAPALAYPGETSTAISAQSDEEISGSVVADESALFTFMSTTPGYNNDYSALCMSVNFDTAGVWSTTATTEGECRYVYEVHDDAGWGGGALVITTAAARPTNSLAPSLSGYIGLGQRITATQGTWSGAAEYTYQWYRCTSPAASATSSTTNGAPDGCTAISGATALTRVTDANDLGKYLRFSVRARKTTGSDVLARWVYSASTSAISRPPAASTSAPPKISGTVATRGKRLTASRGTWTYATGATYEYQWLRCTKRGTATASARPADCTVISLATALTYTPVTADRYRYLRFMVTVTTQQGRTTRVSVTIGTVR